MPIILNITFLFGIQDVELYITETKAYTRNISPLKLYIKK